MLRKLILYFEKLKAIFFGAKLFNTLIAFTQRRSNV